MSSGLLSESLGWKCFGSVQPHWSCNSVTVSHPALSWQKWLAAYSALTGVAYRVSCQICATATHWRT